MTGVDRIAGEGLAFLRRNYTHEQNIAIHKRLILRELKMHDLNTYLTKIFE